MKHYDVICFEGLQSATNHIYDVHLIARMLKKNGLNVAILDVYGIDSATVSEDIEILRPFTDVHKVPTSYSRMWILNQMLFQWKMHWYMKKVLKVILPMASAFYCGSYHCNISSLLLRQKKPCMFWGLRSSRIVPFYRMANESLWGRIRYAYLRHFCLKNHSNYILCSNDIIRDEFIKLGIPKWRLLHREERCVEECVDNYTHASDNLTFLTIGQLRPQKHVEKCIKAFKASNLKALYNIVGRNTDDYEAYLKPLYEGVSSINRVSGFIEPHVFSQYFNAAHFVVFADEKAPSSVTNGTMLEALIHHRPIIAPNYNPYAYYIRLYGIGIQYDYNSESSFVEALCKAAFVGYKSFEKNIMRFLETISFSVSSSQFSDDVKKIINLNKEAR